MITILEIVGIALVFALSFVFGVLFARHNAKKAQAVHVVLFTKVPPKNAGAARVFLPEDVLK